MISLYDIEATLLDMTPRYRFEAKFLAAGVVWPA